MAWNQPLRESEWNRLMAILREWSGMDCPENRRTDLQDATAHAARFAGVDQLEPLLIRLADPSETVLRSVWISAYTIHETYFFRDALQWNAIRTRVLPERIAARANSKTLNIWSAGCSTGEEAYTAAIVLKDVLPDPAWNVKILGTDISADVIEKARQGIYREWSFRQTPLHVREDCFEPVSPASWKVRDVFAAPVRFEHFNLKTGDYPAPARGLEDFDLILCRNVLIYFAREEMDLVLARLTACLAPGGYLALGPAEPFPQPQLPLELVVSAGASLYRKRAQSDEDARPNDTGPKASTGFPAQVRTFRSPQPASPRPLTPGRKSGSTPPGSGSKPARTEKSPAADATPSSGPLAPAEIASAAARAAHDAADAGRWADALTAAESAIAADSLNAGTFYIKALALKELGRLDDSRDALRRCLFIEKRHWMGHLLAAGLWQRDGAPDRAKSHLNAILTGLSAMDPSEILPDTGGINVGRMRALAESQLKHLEGRN